jgi:signal transduction histidine kinase
VIANLLDRRVLHWLRVPRKYIDVRRDEWILAYSRLLLSVYLCIANFGSGGGSAIKLSAALLILYVSYSLAIILALRLRVHWSPQFHIGIHCLDIVWAAHLILLIEWPEMFFALFLFVMASAGFRWGFWECFFTIVALCSLVTAGGLIDYFQFSSSLPKLFYYLYPDGLLCFLLGLIIGLLSEVKAIREKKYAASRFAENIRLEYGIKKTIDIMCAEGILLYGATQILVAMRNENTGEASLFRASRSETQMQIHEFNNLQQEHYFFQAPSKSWRAINLILPGKPQFKRFLLEAGKIKKDEAFCAIPDDFLAEHPFRRLLSVSLDLKEGWNVRIFLIDPLPLFGGHAGLRFLHQSLHAVAPAIEGVLILSHLKSRAEAIAAGHIARDLHDGAIQSLAGILLQIEELRRQSRANSSQIADSLARVQNSIQNEITALRELTQDLRSMEIEPRGLLGHLFGLAAKFQCEHGIETHFVTDAGEIHLQPQVCGELARIAQEALVNVRKHSCASKALVRLGCRNGNWVLSIMDNGRGFEFAGRRSHDELQASGKGPAVIMERARRIGGAVSIQSTQGEGACVEITIAADISRRPTLTK